MSNEQPPHDNSQTAAEGWTSGEISRLVRGAAATGDTVDRIVGELNRRGVPTNTAAGRLTAQMYALFEEFEREHRAEVIAAGGDPDDGWGDTLSRSNLVSVARAHRNASRPDRAREGDLDHVLDDLADEFDLADVRIIRGVAAALADAMPRIAHKHRERGLSPDEIARKTGYTASRVAQFIRQEKERRAAGPLTRYTWRIDTQTADGTWVDREYGDDESTPADLPQLAERLLAETGAHDQRGRIFMWKTTDAGGYSEDAAVYRTERDPQ